MPSADLNASKRTRLTTVCVPNRIQHIPKPLKRAAGPSSFSRAPSRDIDEAEDDLAASDMMRTLMTSTGDEAAEHTKLYKEWGSFSVRIGGYCYKVWLHTHPATMLALKCNRKPSVKPSVLLNQPLTSSYVAI